MFRTFWRATGLIAFSNAAALFLQFITTILIARAFGASAQMDAYTLAVSIPESLQYVLMLATLSVVFTPMFIDARTQHGEREAWSMALSLLVIVVGAVALLLPLLFVLMPWLMYVLAPGFSDATRALAIELSNLILPGLIYYATAGLLLGICYAYHDFVTAAVNTFLVAVLNLVAFVVLVQWLGQGVRGLMIGRLLVLVVLEIFLVWRTLRWKRVPARLQLRQARVWNMLTYLPPYVLGMLTGQLELIVTRSLVSTLGVGSIAAWGYGQRLADIPVVVLGSAIGTTYLPEFAANVAEGKKEYAGAQWYRALERVAFLLAPMAALLFALAVPLITILFQRGAFDEQSTLMTAPILMGLAIGIPWRGIGGLVVRGLPAFKTRRVPILLSVSAAAIMLALDFLLVGVWGAFGLALATSLGEFYFAVAGVFLFQRWLPLQTTQTLVNVVKICLLALMVLCVAWVARSVVSAAWLEVMLGVILGLFVYLSAAYVLGVGEMRQLYKKFRAGCARFF